MDIHHEMVDGITRVRLVGNLDIAGADKIGLVFNALAGNGTRMLVDLREVGFLASMGIRLLLTVGKTVLRRSGKIVLLGPVPAVREVLTTTGIDAMLAIRATEDEALAVLAG